MSNNFEWQKHQANERVRARFQDAATHRQLRQVGGKRPFLSTLKVMVVMIGAIVAIWLLVGCAAPVVEAYPTSDVTGMVMAERIQFQDKLDQELGIQAAGSAPTYFVSNWTMADRIQFQDTIEAGQELGE